MSNIAVGSAFAESQNCSRDGPSSRPSGQMTGECRWVGVAKPERLIRAPQSPKLVERARRFMRWLVAGRWFDSRINPLHQDRGFKSHLSQVATGFSQN